MSILDDLDLSAIQDERAREGFTILLNLVEQLKRENTELRAEVQRLRDETLRLKGEQPKPKIKGNTPKPPAGTPTSYSSEQQRHTPKQWSKANKTQNIRIDREETLLLDRAILPEDAEFKGYEDAIVQDIVFGTDNVRFHKEKLYSPSQSKTYLASLPDSYEGQFGPSLKALTVTLYFGANVSEPKIVELYRDVGVSISEGQLSNLLIKAQETFHAEKAAVVEAGLASSPWQHLDETSTRVNGQNQHCQILCNPLYTAYQTTESKDRQSTLAVLRLGRAREYLYNVEAKSLLAGVLSGVTQKQLSKLPQDQRLDEPTMTRLLAERMGGLGAQQRKWLLDATAVAAYHAEVGFPVVSLLICDDAPQFTWLSAELALCWVHEARRYNQLLPYLALPKRLLAEFMDRFWRYYRELLAYRDNPSEPERERLSAKFDELFSGEARTGYWDLDDRIARTRAKKTELLMVLVHPEIPLHNNPAELGARQRVRKRDVSFGPRVGDGIRAWDTFQSLASTATKLGVSFYAYIHDRISKSYRLPGLDALIAARAKELNLGASWAGP